MHTYLNAGYPHVFCVTLARETKVRGHEDKIDEPSVFTYPSVLVRRSMPGDDFQESAVFGLYVRVLSTFILLTKVPQSRAKLMPSEQRLVFRAKPRRLDEEPKEQMHWNHSPIGILRQMYIGTEI